MSDTPQTKKDVIYIDIEDDITSIIDKVKGAKAPIVALVPPKRIGVLQSVVNLKLLTRAAASVDRRIVLITSDAALTSLAAGVAVPVAKNLQSKPEVPQADTAEPGGEEVIDGNDLPVGELAATTAIADAEPRAQKIPRTPPDNKAAAASFAASAAAKAPKKGTKVPNFDKFRKKLFLIIGGSIALVAFLVWALVFAPHATVAITANTNLLNIDQVLQLRPNATADTAQNLMPVTVKQTKKSASVDFAATGKKDVGEKATGTVKFSTNSISNLGTTIPAGTVLTATGGVQFATDTAVTITISNYQGASTDVTAVERGAASNGASGAVGGAPSGILSTLTGSTSGGTDKTVTVVTQADVDKAKGQLQTQDANAIKTELKKEFGSDMIVIDESFKAEGGNATSSPTVDQEATNAKLTVETTYTLIGIERSDLKANFDAYLKKQLAGKEDQKVYASGDDTASFSQFTVVEGGYTVKVNAQAQVGPQLNESQLKKQLVGKRAGEIQQQLEAIEGIEDVETNFFPFWVTTAPGENKITIKFVLKHNE